MVGEFASTFQLAEKWKQYLGPVLDSVTLVNWN